MKLIKSVNQTWGSSTFAKNSGNAKNVINAKNINNNVFSPWAPFSGSGRVSSSCDILMRESLIRSTKVTTVTMNVETKYPNKKRGVSNNRKARITENTTVVMLM